MSVSKKQARVYLLGNPDKPAASAALEELQAFAAQRCSVVGSRLGLDPQPAVEGRATRIIVLGGDGTLIGVARALGAKQIPLIGVNIGKLGFLTEFSLDEIRTSFEEATSDDGLMSSRNVLHVEIDGPARAGESFLAVNDCVIQAGPPFRIVDLSLSINGEHLTIVRGDGLVACTPTGSTAHNLSAGGPIVQSGVDAIVITPLNPHSLTHRPLVVERDSRIEIHARRVNPGTTAIVDGQVSTPLATGDRVLIRRFEADFVVVRNPRYTRWHKLVSKLHWGHGPGAG